MMRRLLPAVVASALAGLVATLPMSIVMLLMRRRLPWHERYALPPRQVTMGVLEKAHLPKPPRREQRTALTAVAHFLYGLVVGALYAPVAQALAKLQPALSGLAGMVFGLGVWSGSYLGWLPAFGILSPATEHPRRRNILMIVAHLVWGLTLGLLVRGWQAVEPAALERARAPLSMSEPRAEITRPGRPVRLAGGV